MVSGAQLSKSYFLMARLPWGLFWGPKNTRTPWQDRPLLSPLQPARNGAPSAERPECISLGGGVLGGDAAVLARRKRDPRRSQSQERWKLGREVLRQTSPTFLQTGCLYPKEGKGRVVPEEEEETYRGRSKFKMRDFRTSLLKIRMGQLTANLPWLSHIA